MKNKVNFFFLFLFVLVSIGKSSFAQKSDKEAVKETLMNYIEGGTVGDTARFCSAFHASVQGTAAQAKVELVYDTFKFIDFFNLLKINGEWKVVSKIFYKEGKGKQ